MIGAVAGYLSLWLVYWAFKLLTGKEGMGYGDFKMNAAVGAFLGWKMLPLVILLVVAGRPGLRRAQMFAARGRWDAASASTSGRTSRSPAWSRCSGAADRRWYLAAGLVMLCRRLDGRDRQRQERRRRRVRRLGASVVDTDVISREL